MTPRLMCIALLGCVWMGCSNPFSSRTDTSLIGVWGAQRLVPEAVNNVAFLSEGRYYENEVRVGTYRLLSSQYNPSPVPDLQGTRYTVRINYLTGDRVEMRILLRNPLEFNIESPISGGRGPMPGTYDKIHTGDGL